ncbi:T9SS C-terminal target domain-containing protein [bacterium]|nr:MAG: T9SS C-terminal target domain-containing protein [bacterium]
MKLSFYVISIFWLLAALPAAAAESVPYAQGELLIKLREAPVRSALDEITDTRSQALNDFVASRNSVIKEPLSEFRSKFAETAAILKLASPDQQNLDSLKAVLEQDPAVEWVTYNYRYATHNSLDYIPNDSLFSDAWWLEVISAPQAWELTHGDSSVVIGVIDTGTDYLHPDLAANIWRNLADADSNGIDDDNNGFIDDGIGWDFVDAPAFPTGGDYLVRDNNPMDEHGHGTFVGGLACAVTDNETCFPSIGFNCRLMCLRAGNIDGLLEEDDVAAAILYGAANGASVINMSFGDVVASPLLREACRIAYEQGVVLTASAGNGHSEEIHYPSGFPEVISVGATNEIDQKTSFSNFGPWVDVMAPGSEIVSLILGGDCGEWDFPFGTSYAAPMVGAAAALMLSVNGALTPADVLDIIKSSADDLRQQGWDDSTTNGRLNVGRAVAMAAHGSDVVARITFPYNDTGVIETFTVFGEAWGADFDSFFVRTGLGENPEAWELIASGDERHYGDALGIVELPDADTVLAVQLEARGHDESVFCVDHIHLYVQRTAPEIDSMRVTRMLDRDTYADLVQVWSNQTTSASMLLTNQLGDSVREEFGYVSHEHAGLLSTNKFPGRWSVRVRLVNLAGLEIITAPFDFEIELPSFSSNEWINEPTNLPHGSIGSFLSDYDCNGEPEVWILPTGNADSRDTLSPWTWSTPAGFTDTGNRYGLHLPQAYGDADRDGLMEMMARRYTETRIWEQGEPCGVLNTVVFESPELFTEFLGTEFIDLDSSDNSREIVARVGLEGIGSRYMLFQVGSGYSLSVIDTIPNETEGANNLGAPSIVFRDLDNDGFPDFLYGDYDGDIVFCEWTGSEVVQRWMIRLPINDATNWITTGDYDGDGEPEFVAGCRSNALGGTESQRKSKHWEYFVFECVADNEFVKVDSISILGNENISDYPACVQSGDVDADGRDDILISAFPDQYIVQYNPASDAYEPSWHYMPSSSNAILIADRDGDGINEFLFSDGDRFRRVEAASASGERPRPPLALSGEPLGLTSIALHWHAVAENDSYVVNRSSDGQQFDVVASTQDTTISFTDVEMDYPYYWAVQTVNSSFPVQTSVLSNIVQVTANAAPTVEDTAEFIEPHFVKVRFSEVMGSSAFIQGAYKLDDERMPAVINDAEGGRVFYLAFDDTFEERWYTMRISNVRDAQHSLLPASTLSFVVEREISNPPRIVTHFLVGDVGTDQVEITFSQPMTLLTVTDPLNYRMDYGRPSTPAHAEAVQSLSEDNRLVRVKLDSRFPVGAIGLPARMMIRGVTNQSGIEIDTTSGQADLILGGAAVNLNDAYVFPNPYRGVGAGGGEGVHFAGLPEKATIRIFTIQGRLIKEIEHAGFSGAADWDLANDRGDRIASGVYLYVIKSGDDEVRGKLAVMR